MIRAAVIAVVALWLGVARAEPAPSASASSSSSSSADLAVALLPLDAERSLEIYGQPVANQIARALTAGAIPVVVVGAKMAVPERARLIVDGTIAAGKAGAITLALRVRGLDGTVIDTLAASAPGLAKLDAAAADLAARVLPIVRDQLAAIRARANAPREPAPALAAEHGHVSQGTPATAVERTVRFALVDDSHSADGAALLAALEPAFATWMHAHHRQLQRVDVGSLALASHGDDEVSIGLRVLGYTPENLFDDSPIPVGRARVRVQIAGAHGVVFDRVVVTDTVLGERGMKPVDVAARVAREVLDILRPHMRRHVQAWE
ncbi:MAG TPA: hypothetical protein VFP84_21620 [Kofleriaceae bacterium]|nr:hypothetical protein [Kofleriaceae bacterium]